VIKTSKGLNLPISGTPDPIISDTPNVTSVSLLANDFVGMKPTMMVKVGDIVKRGTKLFEDKKNPVSFSLLLLEELLKILIGVIKENFFLLR
jgi:Na+-transporting NADH:ubiquinone oxidoreductase subunit A